MWHCVAHRDLVPGWESSPRKKGWVGDEGGELPPSPLITPRIFLREIPEKWEPFWYNPLDILLHKYHTRSLFYLLSNISNKAIDSESGDML